MINALPSYILYPLAILLSAAISMYSVKKIIFITRHKRLFDTPDNIRKIHGAGIPSLGGIGIFIGYTIVATLLAYTPGSAIVYIFASSVILFFTGIYDDIMNMRPSKKLLAQLIASALTVYFTQLQLSSLYGLLGIEVLPYWAGFTITTIACTFFINVFNFVDGIDGLACTLAILYTGIFGTLSLLCNATAPACISFSLMGATIGLLYYNVPPAKIYMGDTGSMVIGFTIFTLSIPFLIGSMPENQGAALQNVFHSGHGAMTVVIAILFLPIYDAIRVFILRASRGISPFRADRTHLHYYLLDAGFTHAQSVLIILCTNIALIIAGYLLQDLNINMALVIITAIASVILYLIYRLRQKKLGMV